MGDGLDWPILIGEGLDDDNENDDDINDCFWGSSASLPTWVSIDNQMRSESEAAWMVRQRQKMYHL